MTPRILLAPALALLLASPLAVSQDASPATPAPQARTLPAPTHAPMTEGMHRMHMEGRMGERMHRMRMGHGMGAMADLHSLERLYRKAGREKELASVYNEVLAKSQDPRLRTYAYHRLARLQAQPANVDQAIATLRKSLSENLANETKMRAGRERMRAQWQQAKTPTAK